jgi:hypothetical protein
MESMDTSETENEIGKVVALLQKSDDSSSPSSLLKATLEGPSLIQDFGADGGDDDYSEKESRNQTIHDCVDNLLLSKNFVLEEHHARIGMMAKSNCVQKNDLDVCTLLHHRSDRSSPTNSIESSTGSEVMSTLPCQDKNSIIGTVGFLVPKRCPEVSSGYHSEESLCGEHLDHASQIKVLKESPRGEDSKEWNVSAREMAHLKSEDVGAFCGNADSNVKTGMRKTYCVLKHLEFGAIQIEFLMYYLCYVIEQEGSPDSVTMKGRWFLDHVVDSEVPVDTCISCKGGKVGAHRIVLAAASPFIRDLFRDHVCNFVQSSILFG